jgi:hypothetical protein
MTRPRGKRRSRKDVETRTRLVLIGQANGKTAKEIEAETGINPRTQCRLAARAPVGTLTKLLDDPFAEIVLNVPAPEPEPQCEPVAVEPKVKPVVPVPSGFMRLRDGTLRKLAFIREPVVYEGEGLRPLKPATPQNIRAWRDEQEFGRSDLEF